MGSLCDKSALRLSLSFCKKALNQKTAALHFTQKLYKREILFPEKARSSCLSGGIFMKILTKMRLLTNRRSRTPSYQHISRCQQPLVSIL